LRYNEAKAALHSQYEFLSNVKLEATLKVDSNLLTCQVRLP
jgi:hypothetical protein